MRAHSKTNTYCVEVSGWDSSENFFAEKTALTWDAGGEKQITLKSNVPEGCVLFVRLIQPVLPNTVPIAYQVRRVEPVGEHHGNGPCRVSLVQLRPRSSERLAEFPAGRIERCGPQAA